MPLEEAEKSEVVDDLASKIKKSVGLSVDISEAEEGEIEHFEFKTRRWKDLRQESLDKIVSENN